MIEPHNKSNQSQLIYLLAKNEQLSRELEIDFQQSPYLLHSFGELNELISACANQTVLAIILDMDSQAELDSKAELDSTADIFLTLKNQHTLSPALIIVSSKEDIGSRLAAVHLGATHYLTKPVIKSELFYALDNLSTDEKIKPYKILVIDENDSFLASYAILAQQKNISLDVLNKPLNSLAILTEFKPDVIVLNLVMSECSGFDLAQVIHQSDQWQQQWQRQPILFLSTQSNIHQQQTYPLQDGDEFIQNPSNSEALYSKILSKAKFSRSQKQLNFYLQTTLNELKFQKITMNQHLSITETDLEGQIIQANELFCKLSGYSREELLGQDSHILKSAHHPESFFKNLWETIEQGKVWHGKICNKKKNGKNFWLDKTIVPFLDEKGKAYKYVAVNSDITQLKESEQRLKFAIEAVGDSIWEWDIASNEILTSVLYTQTLGYEKNELSNHFDTLLKLVHPNDKSLAQQNFNDYLNGISPIHSMQLRLRCKDGSYKWILSRGTVIDFDSKGSPLRMIGIQSEISQQKNLELELTNARKEAEKANQAKSQFISSMSHELRTPLNAILGFSQLLKMKAEDNTKPLQQNFIDEILTAGEHLLELINEVLELSAIEDKQVNLLIENLNINQILTDVIQLIVPLANEKQIDFIYTQKANRISLEQFSQQQNLIRADKTKLKQVLLNLLSNAVKYNCEKGKITISYEELKDKFLRINITDTGKGLNLEQQAQLFKPFNRLGAENSEITGTGIGLVICKKIIELMGGNIGLNSQAGKGCTFWFDLPQSNLTHELEKTNTQSIGLIEKKPAESIATPQLKQKYSILYIEDNSANLELIKRLISRNDNLTMLSAHEPLLGLELVEKHRPNVILLDINLPGMSGYEVLEILKNQDISKHIPVIAISANAMQDDIKKGFQAGFDDYITKPINIKQLMQAIEKALI